MSGFRRALLCEFELARPDLVRLVCVLALVSILVSTTVGSIAPFAACLFVALAGSLAMQFAAADEAQGWSAARLCAGVTRRDVVLARYAFILSMAVVVTAAECAVAVALSFTGMPGPGFAAASLAPAAMVLCLAFGLLAASVFVGALVPCALRWGLQGAVRYLPFALCVLAFIPFSAALWHVIDDPTLAGATWAAVDANLVAVAGALVVLAAVVIAASITISLRIMRRKDI